MRLAHQFLFSPKFAAASMLLLAFAPFAQADFDPELEEDTVSSVPTVSGVVPASTVAEKPYVEEGPMDLQAYIQKGKTPAYIRINVKGCNIRKTPDFSEGTKDNIDFQSKSGDLMAVESVRPMELGAAVQIHVDGELRWVYVPYKKKDEFQFCESEACFSAMAQSLDFFLKGTGITQGNASECGVNVGPGGLILPPGTPVVEKEPEPKLKEEPIVHAVAREPSALQMKPLWEREKGKAEWTAMLGESLEKYGQRLLSQKNINDAAQFCPNFSRLSREEKKEFFIHLFNGIAKNESAFKLGKPAFKEPLTRNGRVIERGEDVFRGPIIKNRFSMGLFQLSYKEADYPMYRPGCSGFNWGRDSSKRVEDNDLTIYDPKAQMNCAVTIMNTWVPKDGGIGGSSKNGGAEYWSVLRDSNPASREIKASLQNFAPCGFSGRRRK